MHTPHLLIVDDEEYMARLVATLAENAGFATDHAMNAAECRHMLGQGSFDAAIIDIVMPVETGLDLIKWFADEGSKLPIILMSGYSRDYVEGAADDGRRLGVNILGSICKPVRAHDLVDILKELRRQLHP